VLCANQKRPAAAICRDLWDAVQKYSGEVHHQDDFAAVVIKREGLP